MKAEAILTATRKLEDSGMTRLEAEAVTSTIATAVAPLPTRDEVKAIVKAETSHLPTRDEVKAIIKAETSHLPTKDEVKAIVKAEISHLPTKEYVDERIKHLATKEDLASLKVWMLSSMLAVMSTLLFIVIRGLI